MTRKILLTSFQTWLPDQSSNSSDDLLAKILEDIDSFKGLSISLTCLRQLPVDVPQASRLAIAKIEELQPQAIICCGMAQKRTQLTVESGATPRYVYFQLYLLIYFLSLSKFFSVKGLHYGLPILFGSNNSSDSSLIKTSVDLDQLLIGLTGTAISHDAGQFVCEGLYYEVLNYLQKHHPTISCIFVHVPVLTPDNTPSIVADFRMMIHHMASLMMPRIGRF